MGIISKFAQIDKKFAWSFLGFLLAVIFGGIAIYTEFVRDSSPIIKYEVLSNTKILDVKEEVGGLSIIYNEEDIKKSKKTLSIIVIKVSNEGRSAVLKGYYDKAAPLGLVINAGEIIKGEVNSATTAYLQENAKLEISNNKTVTFSDVIVEPNESFIVKFLILNPEDTTPTVTPIGKVANVKKILLVEQYVEQKNNSLMSFLSRAIAGSIWIQLFRIPIYFVGFFVVMLAIFMPIIIVSETADKRRKGKIIRQFQAYTKNKYDESNAKLYEYYREDGLSNVLRFKEAISDDQKFSEFIGSYKKTGQDYEKVEVDPQNKPIKVVIGDHPDEKRLKLDPARALKVLIELGLVTRTGNDFLCNKDKVNAMIEFIDFVVIKETKSS